MGERSVAYVLKGYPRMSELFIASEIYRLEQLGVRLRLYVLKPADEDERHPVVDQIRTQPSYLPETTSFPDQSTVSWLRHNAWRFWPAVRAVARRHPLRALRAVGFLVGLSFRGGLHWPRRSQVKQLLQAFEIADRVERAEDVAHLHGHFAHAATTVTWMVAMLTGLPFSFTGHAKDIYQPSLNPGGLLARKLRAAAFVATCTAVNRDHLVRIAPGARVHVMLHGLNAEFARLLAEQPAGPVEPAPAGRLRVVSVGRLVHKKGFDVLLEAVALVRARGVDVDLRLVGASGEASELVDMRVTELGLGDVVTRMGEQSQADLLALYRSATVFALACRLLDDGDRDGIPNVLVEAMAAGLPVVSTAVSGIPELVDGRNGLLVPPEDPVALADALHELHKDPGLRAELAAAGRATVAERFDGDELARRLAALLPAVCR